MNKFILIDGNAIVHRAYHAIPPMNTRDGKMVNAVYGFASMLFKVWKDLKPTHIAVSFDMAGGTFRHEKYKEYKATRVKADQELYDQIPLCHDLVRALNIPIYEKKGYEADDVIGTIVNKIIKLKVENPIEVIIVTGDKDTIQLISENVKVFTLRKGMSDTIIYDEKKTKEVFGFEPKQMIDYKALAGDSSDNIPGVKGIGEKTALDLLVKFNSVDDIYKVIKNNKEKVEKQIKPAVLKKLIEDEASARMSYDLATIDCDVPDLDFKLKECESKDFDREKVIKILQEFEFTSLLKRIPGTVAEDFPKEEYKNKKIKNEFKFLEIKKVEEVKDLVDKIIKNKQFAMRAIVNGKDVFSSNLIGFALVVGNESFWVPVDIFVKSDFKKIFENEGIELIGHDLKQLIKILEIKNNIKIKCKIFDTMLASYLLNPGSRAHDATNVVLKFLGKELPVGSGQESLFGVDAKTIAQELYLIFQSAEKLKEELIKTNDLGLLEKVEMPLEFVLAKMELNGIAIDMDMLKKSSIEVTEEIKNLTKKIYGFAEMEFNIASPTQLREVLFEKMELPTQGVKKGKTGYSTDAEELEKLRDLHPIINEIQNYRELTKLKNTYIDVLPTLVNKKTGRIHTTFNQAVTATGRLSSSEPNLQNIPIRTELGRAVRKAFIAEEGNFLVSADYSQIELRIVASLAEDKRMMEIFEKDEDIHRATAAVINGVKLENVTKEMRRAAKEVNFGVLYGMGAYGLAWRAEIPQWQAKEFIAKYFEQFSGVKKYLDQTLEFTRKEGYCETLFGRRRYIPELVSGNYQLRSAAERMAINHPVQGTAADLIKMAMIDVDKKLEEKYCHPRESRDPRLVQADTRLCGSDSCPRMILQVHDELVFEVKKELADEVAKIVKEIMEGVVKLRVPVKVETNIGHSWGEMK